MHYNPHSISKVSSILRTYGTSNRLGSVAIELCEKRWRNTKKIQPEGSRLRRILDSEFQTAAELAEVYSDEGDTGAVVRVVLADEDIEEGDKRVEASVASTLKDLLDPNVGWKAIADDITGGYRRSVPPPDGLGYLSTKDLFDVDMLKSAPTAIFRYVSAFVVKKPLKGSLVLLWLALLLGYGLIDGVGDLSTTEGIKAVLEGLVGGLALNVVLGVPLLGRVLLVTLLADRNVVLAGRVEEECERLEREGRGDKVCVVVLGLAHCNGVKRLLCEE